MNKELYRLSFFRLDVSLWAAIRSAGTSNDFEKAVFQARKRVEMFLKAECGFKTGVTLYLYLIKLNPYREEDNYTNCFILFLISFDDSKILNRFKLTSYEKYLYFFNVYDPNQDKRENINDPVRTELWYEEHIY